MFTHEDNELLCRTGRDTPMGQLLREYWHPLLLTTELPAPGGPPMRVRLLGEDLVAFRDHQGRVGLLEERCAHRQASLFFGRNEECGLRCAYHGWQYDVTGQCVDMPNERTESSFAAKVQQPAYPTRERNGLVWAYLGARSDPPPLPDLEWNMVPEERVHVTKVLRQCNWVQTLEGDIDSSHVNFLHGALFTDENDEGKLAYWRRDTSPRMEAVDTDYGTIVGARRRADDDSYFYRVSVFLLPYHTFVAPVFSWSIPGHAWVPVDDYNTMVYNIFWNPHSEISDEWRTQLQPEGPMGPPSDEPLQHLLPAPNRSNDYLVDRELQRTSSMSGVAGVSLQDRAMVESMGPLVDRTKERLGTSDAMIIKTRRRLIDAAVRFRDLGEAPAGVDDPSLFGVRSACIVVPKGESWVEAAREWMEAFTTHEVAFI